MYYDVLLYCVLYTWEQEIPTSCLNKIIIYKVPVIHIMRFNR